jgi:hypothetical protein
MILGHGWPAVRVDVREFQTPSAQKRELADASRLRGNIADRIRFVSPQNSRVCIRARRDRMCCVLRPER